MWRCCRLATVNLSEVLEALCHRPPPSPSGSRHGENWELCSRFPAPLFPWQPPASPPPMTLCSEVRPLPGFSFCYQLTRFLLSSCVLTMAAVSPILLQALWLPCLLPAPIHSFLSLAASSVPSAHFSPSSRLPATFGDGSCASPRHTPLLLCPGGSCPP